MISIVYVNMVNTSFTSISFDLP